MTGVMADKLQRLLASARGLCKRKGAASASSSDAEDRDTWGGRFDFLLSAIGFSVGLGTIWRFPYICYRNGGGAFLLPYVLYTWMLGIPLVLLELSYGQFSSLSPIAVWKMSPLFQGIGYGMVIVCSIVCVYYNVIIAWTLYYFTLSFSWELPWSTCNNTWNTDLCFRRNSSSNVSMYLADKSDDLNITNLTAKHLRTPSEEFWEYRLLGLKPENGIDNIGAPRWQLVLSLLVAWIIVFLCLCKGVKSSGKV